MTEIKWDTENGVLDENDLWTLFSDDPDKPSETVVLFRQIKPLLKKMRLKDETRLYRVFGRDLEYPNDAWLSATVTQRNLRSVAAAISGRGNSNAGIQYLGRSEIVPARPTPAIVKTPPVPRPKPKATPGEKKFPKDDTLGKIVTSYFAALTAEPFRYGGKEYLPRDLYVSPGIVRGYTCPAKCGGCCPRFSLDYIAPDGVPEGEKHPLTMRVVAFNGRQVEVWSDMQKDHKNLKCRNLNLGTGLCNIHGFQPFSCDFELLRSIMKQRVEFTQKLYGRGHDMMRVDGIRGALCEMTPSTPEKVADVGRRLRRLETWMTHFGLNPMRVSHIRANLGLIAETGKPLNIPKDTLLA